MKQVSLKEIAEFIQAQPDDKPVRLYNGSPDDEVRCVLAQYCEQEGIKYTSCRFSSVSFGNGIVLRVSSSIIGLWNLSTSEEFEISTFGELKKVILPENEWW